MTWRGMDRLPEHKVVAAGRVQWIKAPEETLAFSTSLLFCPSSKLSVSEQVRHALGILVRFCQPWITLTRGEGGFTDRTAEPVFALG